MKKYILICVLLLMTISGLVLYYNSVNKQNLTFRQQLRNHYMKKFKKTYNVNFINPFTASKQISSAQDAYNARIEMAKRYYSDMVYLWHNEGYTHHDYATAAYVIITNMELNKDKWLSIGNVIYALGSPEEIGHIGYSFNGNSMSDDIERVELIYQAKGVKISFSVTGFVSSVTYSLSEGSWTGIGEVSWPHKYTFTNDYPIITGLFIDPGELNVIRSNAEKYFSDFQNYGQWLSYMLEWDDDEPGDISHLEVPCSSEIMMIDVIIEDVSRVYFQIKMKGRKVLYCDTWWKKINNNWCIVSNDQIQISLPPGAQSD